MTSVSSPCVSLLAVGIWQVLPHSYQNYSTKVWVPSCVQSWRTLPDPHHTSALQCWCHSLDFLTVLSQNIPPHVTPSHFLSCHCGHPFFISFPPSPLTRVPPRPPASTCSPDMDLSRPTSARENCFIPVKQRRKLSLSH